MVILNKDYWILRIADFCNHGVRELGVDFLIVPPVVRAEDRASMGNVTERPKALVGKAVVVSVLFFLAEPNSPQCVFRLLGWYAEMVVFIRGGTVGIAGTMRDPGSVGSTQDRFHRGYQATGGDNGFDRIA